MKKNFAVIGLGQFGRQIATTLEGLGQQVFGFDKNEEAISTIKDFLTSATILDCTDKACLLQSGISTCDTAVVCLGSGNAEAYLTVLALKEIGIQNIIVRASTDDEGKIFQKIGATKVIFPEKETAIRLANQLTSSDILEYIEVSPDYQVAEVSAPNDFLGRAIDSLKLRSKFGISILAIRKEDRVIVIPSAEQEIEENDILVIVGATNDIIDFNKKFNPKIKK
jgi:trk system potassium uptake protein TrkA